MDQKQVTDDEENQEFIEFLKQNGIIMPLKIEGEVPEIDREAQTE